jgi:hypothetical protein
MDPTKLTEELQGLITKIGYAFFFASYLPALLFVALHQYALLPAHDVRASLLPGVPEVPFLTGELLTTLLVPLLMGVLLVSLNATITQFFEGLYPWQRRFLLRPWQRANQRKSRDLYGILQRWKACYRSLLEIASEEKLPEQGDPAGDAGLPGCRNLLGQLWQGRAAVPASPDKENDSPSGTVPGCVEQIAAGIASVDAEEPFDCARLVAMSAAGRSSDELYEALYRISLKMQRIHEQVEQRQPTQTVPLQSSYARPTALGNAFAVFEEYPLDRYGMDGVLFWPRLRQVVDDMVLGVLDNAKMLLDLQLNLAALGLLFGIEAAITGGVTREVGWWIAAAAAFVVARLAYSAGVRLVRSMGAQVNTCYDLYRGKLLEQFGLAQPDTFFEEYKTWLRLGAFLQRGELFYWPGE